MDCIHGPINVGPFNQLVQGISLDDFVHKTIICTLSSLNKLGEPIRNVSIKTVQQYTYSIKIIQLHGISFGCIDTMLLTS